MSVLDSEVSKSSKEWFCTLVSDPMRALPPDPRTLMEANKKRYEHVQSKIGAWASTTSIPDSLASTPKSPKKVAFIMRKWLSTLTIF